MREGEATALCGELQAPLVAQPCLWPISLRTKHGVLAAWQLGQSARVTQGSLRANQAA